MKLSLFVSLCVVVVVMSKDELDLGQQVELQETNMASVIAQLAELETNLTSVSHQFRNIQEKRHSMRLAQQQYIHHLE